MDTAAATRFARQLALPEVGIAGQERLGAARVAIVGHALAAETAARYLAAAGVGTLRLVGGDQPAREWEEALRGSNPAVAIEHAPRPTRGRGWLEALAETDLVVRAGFDDDAMLPAAIRLGIPAIAMRSDHEAVQVAVFRRHGPCPHAPLDIEPKLAVAPPDDAGSVVAGALAASEALHLLIGNGGEARARVLRLSLDDGDADTQELPWTPECFACGGSGSEMSFS